MGDLIAFFDFETTYPSQPGQPSFLVEFGAILVCPRSLIEVQRFSSLIRPTDLTSISSHGYLPRKGITIDALAQAPTFHHLAREIYYLLHERVWAGHNIIKFDCVRIREAFAEIGRPPPEPKWIIDSWALFTQKFKTRAGTCRWQLLQLTLGSENRSIGSWMMSE